jgi:hypothetical protein
VNGREADGRVHDIETLPPPWAAREPCEKCIRARPAGNRVPVSNLHEHANTLGKRRQLRARYESRGKDGVHGSRSRQAPPARIGRVVERKARTVRVAGDDDAPALGRRRHPDTRGRPPRCRRRRGDRARAETGRPMDGPRWVVRPSSRGGRPRCCGRVSAAGAARPDRPRFRAAPRRPAWPRRLSQRALRRRRSHKHPSGAGSRQCQHQSSRDHPRADGDQDREIGDQDLLRLLA